jgi:transposase InsO family protein
LQIAPSAYWRHAACQRSPALRSLRAQRDTQLLPQVQRVWQANHQVYGAEKVWRQLNREGVAVARCTVERLMRQLGLQGVRRGKAVRTTIADSKAPCPLDRVNRQFRAGRPHQLWVSDFTYVSTWQGWVYVAFVVDVFSRRIVGWRQSSSMHTEFVLDALEQALYDRKPPEDGGWRTTPTGVRNTCPSATANAWPKPASSSQWAPRTTAMTTRLPRPSTGSTRPRSFIGAGRGRLNRRWNWLSYVFGIKKA